MKYRTPLLVAYLCLSLAALMGAASAPAPATKPADDTLTITGKLETGVMAVGGETTGIEITQGNTKFELDINDAVMKKLATALNGKQATVKGTLTIKQGIETGQRRIITVQSIEPAK